MADWTQLADAPAGHDTGYAAAAVHAGELWVIGGDVSGRLDNVSIYNPVSGWRVGTPLATPSDPGPATAAVVSGVAYFVDSAAFYALNLATGAQSTPTQPTSPSWGYGVMRSGGKLYWFRISSPHAYDLATDSWAAVAAPADSIYSGESWAVDPDTGLIYALGEDGWFGAYDPSADEWTALPGLSGWLWGSVMVVQDGVVIVAGQGLHHEFDIATGVWGASGASPLLGTAIGGVLDVAGTPTLVAVGADGATYALPLVPVIPVETTLVVQVSVELPLRTADSYLTVGVDVTGGPGLRSDLLVSFTTGRAVTASAAVLVDVTTADPIEVAPVTNAPVGNPSLAQPGLLTPRVTRELCNADEYQLAWAFGGQLVGSVTALGVSADPAPEDGFAVEATGSVLSREWRSRDVITTTRDYQAATVASATESLLPELMPMATINATPGLSVGGCLQAHTTVLCGEDDLLTRCAMLELLPQALPTRRQLAEAALNEVGIALFILHGAVGIPLLDAVVDVDYRTEGKSPAQVVTDLLLTADAPHWYAPGCLFVHGGGLQAAAFVVPNDCTSGRITTTAGGAAEPEPQLSDYLADCSAAPTPGDCDTDTFETATSGTLTWVERAGAGATYQEVETTLVKEGGRVVREEITTRRAVWTLDVGINVAPNAVIAPVEWTVREHAYLTCCPTALAHSLERTWVTRFNADPNADYESAAGVHLSAYKEVTQTWHAEGWLRSRLETTYQQHGWRWAVGGVGVAGENAEYQVTPTYKASSRSETFVPVGRGMWHVNTRVSDSLLLAVDDGTSASHEVIGSLWGEVVNTFTEVTDAAPPQVTCDDDATDPCDSDASCTAVRTAAWQRDHDNWVAVEAARTLNDPAEKLVMNVEFEGRRLDLRPGALLGEWLVASVSWSGSGPRTSEQPGESTSVELWAVPA